MARPKGSGCALAVHEQLASPAIDHMRLDFTGIVGHIEQKAQIATRKVMRENAPGVVTENLAICQRAIDGRAHGTEITSADLRIDRRTGKLAVGQLDAKSRGADCHFLEDFGSN